MELTHNNYHWILFCFLNGKENREDSAIDFEVMISNDISYKRLVMYLINPKKIIKHSADLIHWYEGEDLTSIQSSIV